MSDLPRAWEAYWFRPIPRVRPFLFERGFLVLLALDLWIVRIPAASRYGGLNFAHFTWLDAIQPVPTPGIQVGALVATGLFAVVVALGGGSLALRVLLLAAYTWSWAMSRLDGFQHHYLLSWVLLCVVCFPARRERGERVEAWGWVLLGASLAIVYFFTAVAKLEAPWLDGGIVRRLAEEAGTAAVAEGWASTVGVGAGRLWQAVAWSVIGAEILVACAYLVAPRRDDEGARWCRRLAGLGGGVAIVLHLGIEAFLDLHIGWFSAYTLLGATTFFLPLGLLEPVGGGVDRLADGCRSLGRRLGKRLGARSARAVAGAVAATALLLATGACAGLPGALTATALVAALVLLDAGALFASGLPSRSVATLAGGAAAAVALALAFELFPARYDFYDRLGGELFRRGEHASALAAYERLSRDAPRFPTEEPVRAFVRERRLDALRRAAPAVESVSNL